MLSAVRQIYLLRYPRPQAYRSSTEASARDPGVGKSKYWIPLPDIRRSPYRSHSALIHLRIRLILFCWETMNDMIISHRSWFRILIPLPYSAAADR